MKTTVRVALCAALCATFPAATLWTRPLEASVAVEMSIERLAANAGAVAVFVPIEQRAEWKDGRIYTYSRLRVESSVAGPLSAGEEVWARTRGGVVGTVGQWVEGEAVLTPGQRMLLFTRAADAGTLEIVGRAQGQYRVALDKEGRTRLSHASNVGLLIADREQSASRGQPARELLSGHVLSDATTVIAKAWRRAHER